MQPTANPNRAFPVQPTANPNRAFPVQPTANPNRAFPVQPTANPNQAFPVQTKAKCRKNRIPNPIYGSVKIATLNEEKKYLRHYNLYMCTPSTDELLTFCLPEQLCTRSVFTTNRTKGYFRHFSTRHVRASFLKLHSNSTSVVTKGHQTLDQRGRAVKPKSLATPDWLRYASSPQH